MSDEPILRAEGLVRVYGRGRSARAAVDGVDLEIRAGETLGLVGESGSGKSTVARMVAKLLMPTSGRVLIEGHDIARLGRRDTRLLRRDVQLIFQDPYSSLNPRQDVQTILTAPFRYQGLRRDATAQERIVEMLERVGMESSHLRRYPHEFSGGQRQRIGIARALLLKPRLVICDEPVSALDVSVQAQVMNLLAELRDEFGLSYLFVAHDLAVVRHISDRVAVMKDGHLVEVGTRDEVYGAPQHPYTRRLLDAAPIPDPRIRRRRPAVS